MLNKLFFSFATLGVMAAVAATGTYKVDIIQDSVINGKQVKAGTYKVEMENNMAVLKHGKDSIEVPAHSQEVASKYSNTSVQYVNNAIQEIRVGGTRTKIVFGDNSGAAGTGGSL